MSDETQRSTKTLMEINGNITVQILAPFPVQSKFLEGNFV